MNGTVLICWDKRSKSDVRGKKELESVAGIENSLAGIISVCTQEIIHQNPKYQKVKRG